LVTRSGFGVLLVGLLLFVGAAASGYAIGNSQAPTIEEASAAREAGHEAAAQKAQLDAARESHSRGLKAGREVGSRRGAAAGAEQGLAAAFRRVDAELAEIAAGEEAAAAERAAAATETEVFCPIAADNSCTPSEMEQLNATEAYCGGPDSPEC
jgi:hypothetical protein